MIFHLCSVPRNSVHLINIGEQHLVIHYHWKAQRMQTRQIVVELHKSGNGYKNTCKQLKYH